MLRKRRVSAQPRGIGLTSRAYVRSRGRLARVEVPERSLQGSVSTWSPVLRTVGARVNGPRPCRPILVLIARGDWRAAAADVTPTCVRESATTGQGVDEIAWAYLLIGKACSEVVMTPDKIKLAPTDVRREGADRRPDLPGYRGVLIPRATAVSDSQSVGVTGGILWCG